MTRRLRRILGGSALAVALVLAGCGGDDEPGAEETTTPSPEAVITAPPTKTPEEEAEEEIVATFERLIADMDEYYANASDYTAEEVAANSPAAMWHGVPGTGEANLELSNWTVHWRSEEVEAVGDTIVMSHEVTSVRLNVADSDVQEATSVACRDLTGIQFVAYDGQPTELSFDPNQYQVWDMVWRFASEGVPGSGIEEPGWYLESFELTLDEPC